jgi:hypothetical protein
MRILAFITAAEPVDAILTRLGLPATAPPLSPARGPFTSTTAPSMPIAISTSTRRPAYDLTEPEPVPDFDFGQSADA